MRPDAAAALVAGGAELALTTCALLGFWRRYALCPYWSLLLPLKQFLPKSVWTPLGRVERLPLLTAQLCCLYQIQAGLIVAGGLGVDRYCTFFPARISQRLGRGDAAAATSEAK